MGTLAENQRIVDEYIANLNAKNATPHTNIVDPQDVQTTRMNPMGGTTVQTEVQQNEPFYGKHSDGWNMTGNQALNERMRKSVDVEPAHPDEQALDRNILAVLHSDIIALTKAIDKLNDMLPGLSRSIMLLCRAYEDQTKKMSSDFPF